MSDELTMNDDMNHDDMGGDEGSHDDAGDNDGMGHEDGDTGASEEGDM